MSMARASWLYGRINLGKFDKSIYYTIDKALMDMLKEIFIIMSAHAGAGSLSCMSHNYFLLLVIHKLVLICHWLKTDSIRWLKCLSPFKKRRFLIFFYSFTYIKLLNISHLR